MKTVRQFATNTRVISFILTLLLIFYTIPAAVFAEALTDGTTEAQDGSDLTENAAENEVFEAVELREEYVKHFRLEDGSYLAASYTDPVHYLDEDGIWQDIDNRLFSYGSEFSTQNARVKFAKKITGNETLFTLHENDAKITMSLVGAKKKTEGVVTTDYTSDDLEETKLGKLMNLENLMSKILYEDILDGVDIEYVVHSFHIKENIIVKEKSESYTYSFNIKLNKLIAEISENGDVVFSDENACVKYRIPAPVVYDSFGNIAPEEAAYYTLTGSGNKYILTVTVDAEWMNGEDVLFPVTIDPTVENESTASLVNDTTEGQSSLAPYLVIESAANPSFVTLSSLPTISSSSIITNAKITFQYMRSSGRVFPSVAVYDVITTNKNGTVSMTKDNTVVDYEIGENPKFEYEFDITTVVQSWYENPDKAHSIALARYVTPAEDMLVTGGGRIGVMHLYSSESLSSYYTTPITQIAYAPMQGLEDYWSYTSQSAGIAGTGHVNLATGNLVFAIDTLTSTDHLMPVTLSLVYNSADSGKAYNYYNAYTPYNTSFTPYGFKLNINQTVMSKSIVDSSGVSATYYLFTDADGTTHRFESGEWTDEDGLGLKMQYTDAEITITDRDKTVKTFTYFSSTTHGTGWYLSKITDKAGNSVIISVDSSYRPLVVSLLPSSRTTAIDMLQLTYNSAGVISVIESLTENKSVRFMYSSSYDGSASYNRGGYLRKAVYIYGSSTLTAEYKYNYRDVLLQAKDTYSNSSIEYEYSGSKIVNVREYGNNELGQQLSLNYGNGYTVLRASGTNDIFGDNDDIYTYYIYDENGRVTNYYSCDVLGRRIYGAVVGEYETQDNVKNNVKETTTLGGSSTNYLLNGSFDTWTKSNKPPEYWNATDGTVTSYSQINDGQSLNDVNSLRFYASSNETPKSVYQYVFLPSGEYTLSLSYKTIGYTPSSFSLFAESQTTPSDTYTKALATDTNDETDQLTESITFTVNNRTNGGDVYKVGVLSIGSSEMSGAGFICINDVTLTEGVGAAHHNYLDAGHFDDYVTNSTGTHTVPATDFWTTDSAAIVTTSAPFGKVLKINGEAGVVKESKNRVFEMTETTKLSYGYTWFQGNTGGEYAISAFGYTSAELSASTTFGIRVDVYYYQGEGNEDILISYDFDFQNNPGTWQFLTGTFKASYVPTDSSDTNLYNCIHYIDIVCVYSGQPDGYAYFDNISVTDKTDYGSYSYEYDALGRLVKKSNVYYFEIYTYDSNNNLVATVNSRNEKTTYEYDSNNNLKKERYYSVSSNIDPDYTVLYMRNEYGLVTSAERYTPVTNSGQIVYSENYTYYTSDNPSIFGALKSENVTNGYTTTYTYLDTKLQKVQTGNLITLYTYDDFGRVTKVTPGVANTEEVNYTYNSKGELSAITTDTTTYNFAYDAFGNSSSVSVGTAQLAEYEYNPNNGKLIKVVYENGFYERYVYNDLEILTEVWYNYGSEEDILAVKYTYTADGLLHTVEDYLSDRGIVYTYDANGKLIESGDYALSEKNYYRGQRVYYTSDGKVSYTFEKFDYLVGNAVKAADIRRYYTYNEMNGLLTSSRIYWNSDLNINYSYDEMQRLTSVGYLWEGTNLSISEEYTYDQINDFTTNQICSYTSRVGGAASTYGYTYDNKNYLTKVTTPNGEIRYTYDNIGQLIREDNVPLNQTYVYTYDNAGNLLLKETYALTAANSTPTNPSDIKTYTYGNTNWGDQLTAYNGTTITYDEVGNPINYYNGFTFGWSGRNLTSASNGNNLYSFVYNSDGLRTEKTVNGVVHTYYYSGSQLLAEEWNGNLIVFLYDANGAPIGMRYRTASYAQNVWDTYFYEKNLQGDIVAIYSETGTKLVSYTYDAWGNQTVTYHNGGASITTIVNNPIRYRGYYYDTDLGLYYLQTRYYDSSIGRFISSDGYISTGTGILGYNMYAYCNNNPVMYVDYGGEIVGLLLITIVVICLLSSCSSESEPESATMPQKSITDDINMYDDETGSYQEGKINVKFSPGGENPSFQIENSYKITNDNEQRAILEYIVASDYYAQGNYGRTVESMMIEWDAHTDYYYNPMSVEIDKLFGLTTRVQAQHVDFDRQSEGLEYSEYILKAGLNLLIK